MPEALSGLVYKVLIECAYSMNEGTKALISVISVHAKGEYLKAKEGYLKISIAE